MPQLRVCCCGPGSWEISIDCCTASGPAVSSSGATARRAAANAGSATLSAYYYFLTPVLNSQGMEKLRYAIQKSTKIKLK